MTLWISGTISMFNSVQYSLAKSNMPHYCAVQGLDRDNEHRACRCAVTPKTCLPFPDLHPCNARQMIRERTLTRLCRFPAPLRDQTGIPEFGCDTSAGSVWRADCRGINAPVMKRGHSFKGWLLLSLPAGGSLYALRHKARMMPYPFPSIFAATKTSFKVRSPAVRRPRSSAPDFLRP